MDTLPTNNSAPKKTNFKWFWIVLGALVLLGGALIFFSSDEDTNINKAPSPTSATNLSDRFGFLGGGFDDSGEAIVERGAGWVRPHPGGFLWDAMQSSKGDAIDFSGTDEEIKNLQKNNFNILVTIWGFADWDQKNLPNSSDCKVSSRDEFLSRNDKKDRGYYLPEYRCNPNDWQLHNAWVEAIIERYDGDGISDMSELKKPIKYWEVMNEPDLSYKANLPAGEENRLTFYKQGPLDYGELLKNTYTAIKKADANAQVLIAGAAGADEQMLNFYETLFMNMPDAPNYFDIGNIHCISNDQKTSDLNVAPYKKVLETAGITAKPIWVTEAEAMYGKTAQENFEATKTSVQGAIEAGAQKIFFTRYEFDDFRQDMSQKTKAGSFPSAEKYRDLIKEFR